MLNYLYNNLPIIKLLDKYSIWTLDSNEDVIIYLFDTCDDAYMMAGDLDYNTYFIFNKGIQTTLKSLNVINTYYFKLNRYIQNTRIKLESIEYPEWEFFEEKLIDITVKEINFDININKILSEIFMLLKLHYGDIKQLANIIEDIKFKFETSRDQEYFMDEFIKNLNNELFILINIRKVSDNRIYKWFKCFNLFKKDDRYLVKYIISKPKNDSAINIAKHLMNEEIDNKIKYIKNYN